MSLRVISLSLVFFAVCFSAEAAKYRPSLCERVLRDLDLSSVPGLLEGRIKTGAQFAKSVVPRIRVLDIKARHFSETDGRQLGIVPIREIFSEYDPARELLIGIRATNVPHIYIVANGRRFDGNVFGVPSYESSKTHAVSYGVIFRFRNVDAKDVASLNAALVQNPNTIDINCYSAAFQFLERYSRLRLQTERPELPLLPSEYLSRLFDGALVDAAGRRLEFEVVSVGGINFEAEYNRLVSWENGDVLSHHQKSAGFLGDFLAALGRGVSYRQLLFKSP